MMIEEARARAAQRFEGEKEIKVRIPARYHILLHSMKTATGKAISETVSEALQGYFEAQRLRA
ncbi:MAG: hypothetical protein ACT4PT_03715 [Methanobacteriota archaeon]